VGFVVRRRPGVASCSVARDNPTTIPLHHDNPTTIPLHHDNTTTRRVYFVWSTLHPPKSGTLGIATVDGDANFNGSKAPLVLSRNRF
jgi:hypothetical protein